MRRVGLLGGAFNPPHDGHLALARLALARLELDELRIVPTALSPHKPTPGDIADGQRLALVEAAFAGLDPRVVVDGQELARGGTSYTADTLEALAARAPEDRVILVIGSDQLPGLPRWRRAETIFRLASVAVAERPGQALEVPPELPLRDASRWSGAPGELVRLPSTEVDLASTAVRDDLRHNRATPGLPPPVARLIDAENLYK